MLSIHKIIFLACLVASNLAIGIAQSQAAQNSQIYRAVFSTAIQEREPVDQVLVLTNRHNRIFFHTDLRHFENQKIIHRWEYEGRVVSSKAFEVKGPRWRVYSSKTLNPEQLGTWRVMVTTEQGWPLKAVIFKYVDSDSGENAILPLAR
ncbi:MAG: DUF2914 domain-containing protein [Thioalkalispiraceae bacterium]|jgi:hypothetical protein